MYVCNNCKTYFQDNTPKTEKMEETLVVGITENELRAKYDVRFQIRQAVKLLEWTEEGIYLTQADFVQRAKIKPGAGYRDILDHAEFDTFRGKAPGGTIYWSHPDSISKLKNQGILQ